VHSLKLQIGAYSLTPTLILTPTLDLLNLKSTGFDIVCQV